MRRAKVSLLLRLLHLGQMGTNLLRSSQEGGLFFLWGSRQVVQAVGIDVGHGCIDAERLHDRVANDVWLIVEGWIAASGTITRRLLLHLRLDIDKLTGHLDL